MQDRYGEAGAALQPVLDDPDGPLVSEGDSPPECLLTLVEIYERTGRAELAGQTLDRAGVICDNRGLAGVAARGCPSRSPPPGATGNRCRWR